MYPINIPTTYQISGIVIIEINPGQFLKVQVSIARLKVESVSHHDNTHYHPSMSPAISINVIHHVVYWMYSSKILKVKVTTTRSNQGHTMRLRTYTANQCPDQVSATL